MYNCCCETKSFLFVLTLLARRTPKSEHPSLSVTQVGSHMVRLIPHTALTMRVANKIKTKRGGDDATRHTPSIFDKFHYTLYKNALAISTPPA